MDLRGSLYLLAGFSKMELRSRWKLYYLLCNCCGVLHLYVRRIDAAVDSTFTIQGRRNTRWQDEKKALTSEAGLAIVHLNSNIITVRLYRDKIVCSNHYQRSWQHAGRSIQRIGACS